MRVTVGLGVIFFAVSALFAGVPNEITYQGRLREYGQPANGVKTMNFKIYSSESGADQVWGSGNVDVLVSTGVFCYTLVPNVDWRQKDLWIETVVSGKTLTPREKITAQAFALHARTAEDVSKSAGSNISFAIGNETKATLKDTGEFSSIVGGTTYYMVPRGAIIMWSGTIANIPSGWVLCDGNNGTPDLRDRFILSVANVSENPGTVGGSSMHSHALNDYNGATGGTGDHQHNENIFDESGLGGAGLYVPRPTGGTKWGYALVEGTDAMSSTVGFSGGGRSISTAYTPLTSPSGSHSHTMNHGHLINNTMVLPPFYKLAFIMKL